MIWSPLTSKNILMWRNYLLRSRVCDGMLLVIVSGEDCCQRGFFSFFFFEKRKRRREGEKERERERVCVKEREEEKNFKILISIPFFSLSFLFPPPPTSLFLSISLRILKLTGLVINPDSCKRKLFSFSKEPLDLLDLIEIGDCVKSMDIVSFCHGNHFHFTSMREGSMMTEVHLLEKVYKKRTSFLFSLSSFPLLFSSPILFFFDFLFISILLNYNLNSFTNHQSLSFLNLIVVFKIGYWKIPASFEFKL